MEPAPSTAPDINGEGETGSIAQVRMRGKSIGRYKLERGPTNGSMGAVARTQSGGGGHDGGGDDQDDSHLNGNGNGIGMIGRSASAEEYRPERKGGIPYVNGDDAPQDEGPSSRGTNPLLSRSLSSGSGSFRNKKSAANFRTVPIPSKIQVPHKSPTATSPTSRRIGTASAVRPRSGERREEPEDEKLPGQPISTEVDEDMMLEGGAGGGARSSGKDDGWTGGDMVSSPGGQEGGNIEGEGKVRVESREPSSRSVLSAGKSVGKSSREASPVRRGGGSTPGSIRGESSSPVRKEGGKSSREASPDRSGRSIGYTPSAATNSARGGLYPRGDFFGDEREGEAKLNSAQQGTYEESIGNQNTNRSFRETSRSFRETSRSDKSPRQPQSSRNRPQSSKESSQGKKKEMGVLKRHGSLIAEDEGRIVTINCGGVKHQTLIHTLRKFPGTLLADLAKGPDKDSPGGALYTKGEIFIDRNTTVFEYIINFYRTDRLFQPSHVPDELWNNECIFFKIQNPKMKIPTAEETIKKQIEQGMPTEKNSLFTLRKEVWLLFEDPSSSFTAKLISIWSMIVILVGVSAFIAETHPSFRVKSEYDEDKVYYGVAAYTVNQAFSAVETTVIVFFSAELLLRFLATAKKIYFWQQLINWIDLVAVAPFYFDILGLKSSNGTMMLRVVRLVRVFRIIGLILKLGKYSQGARVLALTVAACVRELVILTVVLIMAVVLFASGVYYCENPDQEQELSEFNSIGMSMYWASITITTVGYGDMVPQSACGQMMAVFASISGIFCLGLPISIITVKFTERYNDLVHEWTIEEERVRLAKLDKKLAANRAVLGFGSVMASIIKKEGLVNQMMGLIPGRSKPTQEEIVKEVCKQLFAEVDEDKSGEIDAQELHFCLEKLNMQLDDDAFVEVLNDIDIDRSGSVNFEEFLEFINKALVKSENSAIDGSIMKLISSKQKNTSFHRTF